MGTALGDEHGGTGMRILTIMACLIVIGVASGGGPAAAHSPYYKRSETIHAEGQNEARLALLSGDGIFFADPVRAVIVDPAGHLLAVSPISTTLDL